MRARLKAVADGIADIRPVQDPPGSKSLELLEESARSCSSPLEHMLISEFETKLDALSVLPSSFLAELVGSALSLLL
jgi:hypothetical protein